MRVFVRRQILHALRIEHDHVRLHPFAQHAAVAEARA
jgi:hypothetical protein